MFQHKIEKKYRKTTTKQKNKWNFFRKKKMLDKCVFSIAFGTMFRCVSKMHLIWKNIKWFFRCVSINAFLMLSDGFDMLILKINKKYEKDYFDVFLSKKYF